jgi:hypothetical protein
MTAIKNIIVAATLSAALSLAPLGAAQAQQGIKPMQGVSFHAGTKHGVAYFVNDKRTCQLVLTLVDDASSVPSRFEATIEPGKSTQYPFTVAKSLEFACQADGRTMDVKALETTAAK